MDSPAREQAWGTACTGGYVSSWNVTGGPVPDQGLLCSGGRLWAGRCPSAALLLSGEEVAIITGSVHGPWLSVRPPLTSVAVSRCVCLDARWGEGCRLHLPPVMISLEFKESPFEMRV